MMQKTSRLRLAGGAAGFNWLPVFVAETQGIFAKYGIEFEFMRLGTVDKATLAVAEGVADIAITPPEGAIADYVKGGPLRIIASNSERLPMSLVAAPGIKSVAALKGKRIGTSSLTEGTAIYTQIMLAEAGLIYPRDYEFVLAGIHTKRWEALQSGDIDCAPQPAPWNFLAANAGYNLLGEVSEAIPEVVFAALVGNMRWLQDNRDMVVKLLRALSEAHEIANDLAAQDITLPIFQRITTPDNAELALRGLVYMRDLGMWPKNMAVSNRALKTSIDLMIRAHLLDAMKRESALGVLDSSYLIVVPS